VSAIPKLCEVFNEIKAKTYYPKEHNLIDIFIKYFQHAIAMKAFNIGTLHDSERVISYISGNYIYNNCVMKIYNESNNAGDNTAE